MVFSSMWSNWNYGTLSYAQHSDIPSLSADDAAPQDLLKYPVLNYIALASSQSLSQAQAIEQN